MPTDHRIAVFRSAPKGTKPSQRHDDFARTVPGHDKYRDAAKLVVEAITVTFSVVFGDEASAHPGLERKRELNLKRQKLPSHDCPDSGAASLTVASSRSSAFDR